MENKQRAEGLRLAIEKMGSARAARALGLSQQALWQWHRVPSHRILQVEAVTGVPRELLRPDLYDQPPEPLTKPLTYVVTLRAGPGDPIKNLRHLLKYAWRTLKLRCVSAEERRQ
jgi:DNA-binding transcriptional regulator YdaS (Cro superfamily)